MLSVLETLQGSARLHPGNRALDLGLDHHHPLAAVEALVADDDAMSVALHEIAHFHSLDNVPGSVLTLFGLLTNLYGEAVEQQIADHPEESEALVRAFLGLRSEYLRMLEAWRPLLEGIAVAVQVSRPCPQLDQLVQPLADLHGLGLTLAALGGRDLEPVGERLLTAGHRSMARGPGLTVGDRSLAANLEFATGAEWLPYFLGTAYVRGVLDRMARAVPALECPELAINWLIAALRSSGRRLQGRETRWDLPDAVERLYGWLEIVERAPAARAREAVDLPWDIDSLLFLKTGERVRSVRPDLDDHVAAVAESVPEAWRHLQALLGGMDLDAVARAAGDAPLRLTRPRENVLASAWLVGTQSLRVCSGGTVQVMGRLETDDRVVVLKVASDLWGLICPTDTDVIDRGALEPGSWEHWRRADVRSTPQSLLIDCSYTRVAHGITRSIDAPGSPVWLFALRSPAAPERMLLTTVVPGQGRAYLAPVPAETTAASHAATERMRADVAERLSLHPGRLAAFVRDRGAEALAHDIEAHIRSDSLTVSRIADLCERRMLVGLLGAPLDRKTQRAITGHRMTHLVPDQAPMRELAATAYGRPCGISGAGRSGLLAMVTDVNRDARASIGKDVFAVHGDGAGVEYLGLWGKR